MEECLKARGKIMNKKYFGYLSAIITIIIWGTTFISTKLLLKSFLPIEILFFRFLIGFLALIVVYPKWLKGTSLKQEFTFAAAGLCGITLYYLLENIALTYTTASAVGVIISTAPFFTAILSYFISGKKDKLSLLFLGFGASALCFVTWNFAVKGLGAVKTSVYIYLVPVITVLASVLILKEKETIFSALGAFLTLSGLILSQIKNRGKKNECSE